MVSLAKPCTTMALDCTPTFPAVACMRGTKIRSSGNIFMAPLKLLIITPAPKPPHMPINSQGNRALVSSKILSSASTSVVIPAANW